MSTPESAGFSNRGSGGFVKRNLRFDDPFNVLQASASAPPSDASDPKAPPSLQMALDGSPNARGEPVSTPLPSNTGDSIDRTQKNNRRHQEDSKHSPPTETQPGKRETKSAPLDEQVQKIRRNAYLSGKGVDPNMQHQLDLLFPEEMGGRGDLRHIPNDLARTSLFTTRNNRSRNPRKALLHQKLFHYNEDIEIIYTGIELRAEDDELVWLQILKYSESVPMGLPFSFEIKDLVRDIGWARNGGNYNRVRECISRLKANEIQIKNSKAYGQSGAMSLIHNYTTINNDEGEQTRFCVHIDKNMILLFAGNTFTSHTWNAYRELTPTARRLADYIQSHRNPYPLDAEKFRKMCGSEYSDPYDWRIKVRRACNELTASGITAFATVDKSGMIIVQRAAQPLTPPAAPQLIG